MDVFLIFWIKLLLSRQEKTTQGGGNVLRGHGLTRWWFAKENRKSTECLVKFSLQGKVRNKNKKTTKCIALHYTLHRAEQSESGNLILEDLEEEKGKPIDWSGINGDLDFLTSR